MSTPGPTDQGVQTKTPTHENNEESDAGEEKEGDKTGQSTRSYSSRSDSYSDSDSDSNSHSSSSSTGGSSMSGSGSEQEDMRDYKRGGYHPLKPKDFLNNRYLIIRKLGWGHFSTVWMAFDQTDRDFKALKVVRSAGTYTETARDEIDLLQHAAKADSSDPHRHRIVQLHESFELDGPFGHHVVLVMEITGPSLFSVGRRARENGMKLQTVRNITKRVLEGLAYMHDKAHMIHTDLKPENLALEIGFAQKMHMAKDALRYTNEQLPMPKSLVCTYYWDKNEAENRKPGAAATGQVCVIPGEAGSAAAVVSDLVADKGKSSKDPSAPTLFTSSTGEDPATDICDPSIKIVDMGNACWTYKKFTSDIQTREYRAFEVLMGADYAANVDVWSLGCIAFELATSDYLFNPRHGEDFVTDEDHVAQMIERLGNPSKKVSTKGKYCHKFFNRRGHFKCFDAKELDPQSITMLLMEEYRWKNEEARSFAQFIEACLVYDPLLRPSAATLLNHPFFSANLREDYIQPEKAKKSNEAGDRIQSECAVGSQEKCGSPCRPSQAEDAKPATEHPPVAAFEHPNKSGDPYPVLDLSSLNIGKPRQ